MPYNRMNQKLNCMDYRNIQQIKHYSISSVTKGLKRDLPEMRYIYTPDDSTKKTRIKQNKWVPLCSRTFFLSCVLPPTPSLFNPSMSLIVQFWIILYFKLQLKILSTVRKDKWRHEDNVSTNERFFICSTPVFYVQPFPVDPVTNRKKDTMQLYIEVAYND